MSHVPAKMSTMPAQRSCPAAASPAATKVSARPTTVTWFGVSGVLPRAVIRASAWRRTQASNRVVNIAHLQHGQGLRGKRSASLLVDLDHLGGDDLPRVAARLVQPILRKARSQLGVAGKDDQRCGELSPVLWRHRDAVAPGL